MRQGDNLVFWILSSWLNVIRKNYWKKTSRQVSTQVFKKISSREVLDFISSWIYVLAAISTFQVSAIALPLLLCLSSLPRGSWDNGSKMLLGGRQALCRSTEAKGCTGCSGQRGARPGPGSLWCQGSLPRQTVAVCSWQNKLPGCYPWGSTQQNRKLCQSMHTRVQGGTWSLMEPLQILMGACQWFLISQTSKRVLPGVDVARQVTCSISMGCFSVCR